jgi:general secretion pathway protein D
MKTEQSSADMPAIHTVAGTSGKWFPGIAARALLLSLMLGFACLPASAADTDVAEADTFALNLTDADIQAFIQSVSEITGRNFVIDPRVKGKVTVITATPTNADRIYEIFLSVLQVNGFVAIPSGDVIKVVPDAGAAQRASDNIDLQGGDELVTRVVPVENVSVKQLAASLKPLMPPTAYMSAHQEAKVLVIADSARNIERMSRIIASIDAASGHVVELVSLLHSDATQIIETLKDLDQQSAQRAQAPGGRIASMVADTRTNSILISGPAAERRNLRELIERLDVPTETTLKGARVFYLKHAVASDLQAVLKGIGDKLIQNAASTKQQFEVQADEATNALIVSAPTDLMTEVRSLIDQLDIPRQQVQVEGVIAEISSERGAELGVEWRTSVPGDGLGGILRTPLSGSTTSSIPPGLGAGGGFPGVAGSGLSLGYFSNGDLRALLKALASDTTTKILSTPTVVTLDNKKASIHVGQNVPIVTGTFTNDSGADDPFQTIERRDVGIKLEVTPQINEGDTVRMEIRQEVSNVDPATDGTSLITNERTIETTVQVDNGQIIALGGLISDDVSEQKTGIPIVSDIPLVGNLFSSRRSVLERRNLVVFLRPTIIDREAQRLTEERYRQMRELQIQEDAEGRTIELMPGVEPASLPPYPPDPHSPVISQPPDQPVSPRNTLPDDEFQREYSFFDL